MEWGWHENRHIIRTILVKAINYWDNNKTEKALVLLRKLLSTNVYDNVGARNYILAINMGMSHESFKKRFEKDGYYTQELTDWFDKNYSKFPSEFSQWEKCNL